MEVVKKRTFQEGVLVDIRMKEAGSSKLIIAILDLIIKEHRFSIGPSHSGGGAYVAFHTKDDAARISQFITEYMKKEE
jgi:hypothetical protein